jgi:Protein of unknown function (DUF1559)
MWETSFLVELLLWLVACGALVAGILAFRASPAGSWRRRLAAIGSVVALVGVGLGVRQLGDFLEQDFAGAEVADVMVSRFAIAAHSYRDEHGRLPPAFLASPQGRPLLSWRVLLLPYIEQKALYDRFHLEEPWDSPGNIKLLKEMPRDYAAPPGAMQPGPSHTYWHVFVGESTVFVGAQGLRYPEDIPDGPQNIVLLVLGGPAVLWSKPDDIVYSPEIPLPNLCNVRPRGFFAAMCDASSHFVEKGVSEITVRAAITRNGAEKLEPSWWRR